MLKDIPCCQADAMRRVRQIPVNGIKKKSCPIHGEKMHVLHLHRTLQGQDVPRSKQKMINLYHKGISNKGEL